MKVFGTHTHIHKIGKKYTLFLHGSLGGGFLLPLPKPSSADASPVRGALPGRVAHTFIPEGSGPLAVLSELGFRRFLLALIMLLRRREGSAVLGTCGNEGGGAFEARAGGSCVPDALSPASAPYRLRTELPQALRLQHPQQLQWGSQAAPVLHVSGQWPFGAPRHLGLSALHG